MPNITQKSRVIIVLCAFVLVFAGLNYWKPFTSKPVAMGEIKIRSNMTHLDWDELQDALRNPPVFTIKAKSILPLCYFEHAQEISENVIAMRNETNWFKRGKLKRKNKALHRARAIARENDVDKNGKSK